METLKPCPFCGSAAEIVHARNYYAWCDSCETRGDWYSTEAEAVKAWNTRTATTIGRVVVEVVPTGRTCKNAATEGFGWECSECGLDRLSAPNYCPRCGAKAVNE